jgi:hypothetical protein
MPLMQNFMAMDRHYSFNLFHIPLNFYLYVKLSSLFSDLPYLYQFTCSLFNFISCVLSRDYCISSLSWNFRSITDVHKPHINFTASKVSSVVTNCFHGTEQATDHSLPSSTAGKKEWSFHSLLYVFMAWRLNTGTTFPFYVRSYPCKLCAEITSFIHLSVFPHKALQNW